MQERWVRYIFRGFFYMFVFFWCIYSRTNGILSLQHMLDQLCFALTAFYTIWSFLSIFQLKLLGTYEMFVD